MSVAAIAAEVAAALLVVVIIFELLLVAGAPLGRAAWGGVHRVLPPKLRWGSGAAAVMLIVAGWVVLARAALEAPGPGPLTVRMATWASAAFFALNTVGSLGSESRVERLVMSPVMAALAICFTLVAVFGP